MLTSRRPCLALFSCLLLVILLYAVPVAAQDTEDAQLFLSGFNAYQQKNYPTAVTRLGDVLQKYPETPLRDMTLFWLARAHYKAGNRQDAGRYMAQFTQEYPDNPLKNTVEEELLVLAADHAAARSAALPRKDEQAQLAAARQSEEQRRTAEAAERLAREKAEQERIAREKAAQEEIAEQARKRAAETAAQAQAAQDAAEKARLLRAKAEALRLAREKAEAERLAQQQAAEEQRKVAEAERVAREQAEAERKRIAVQEAEQRRIADQLAEQQRLAMEKDAEEQRLREQAEAERLAAITRAEEQQRAAVEAEKLAREKAAQDQAAEQVRQRAVEKAAREKAEAERLALEKQRQEKQLLKEKAISEYRSIVERFPGSAAARTAAVRLRELGVVTPASVPVAVAAPVPVPATQEGGTVTAAQVLNLEVAQYAAFTFDLQTPSTPATVAQQLAVPFEIQNHGNGQDSFYLASGFPAEYGVRFVAAAAPEQSINQTPDLAAGERFKGLLKLALPPTVIDGLRIAYPVKAASRFMGEASQSRVVSLVAAAPLLRTVLKTDKQQLQPGERLLYRVVVLNVGSTVARDVSLRLNYPAQLQPVEGGSAGFRQEMQAALVQDSLTLQPGESRELIAAFQLKESALAGEELILRADLHDTVLQTRSSFLSDRVVVLPVSELAVRIAQDQTVVVPGQTVGIPARIINRGNRRERVTLTVPSSPFQKTAIYHDLNRDGMRQPGEPEVSVIGPLEPAEEVALLLDLTAQRTVLDGTVEKLSLHAVSEAAQSKGFTAESRIVYSRPVVQLSMKGRQGRMVPGELLTVACDLVNNGSHLARQVEMEISWPDQLELVTADQPACRSRSGASAWCFNELGAGEKRTVKASFRIKSGTGVGTGVQLKSQLNYQDHLGNRY